MSTSAQYASTPKVGSALLTTGDTSLTTPSTFGTVLTAGSNGSRIDYIKVNGVATTSTAIINLFIYDGSTYSLWQQIPVTAVTSSITNLAFTYTLSSNSNADVMPLTLPTGYSLRATVTQTQTGIRVLAYGGDF